MAQRILGVDYGKARHGLAISDELGMLAHPLKTVAAEPEKPGLEAIAAAARESKVALVVVGMPRNMDGSYGPAADYVRAFCAKLAPLLPCPIRTWDERLTTVQAQRSLQEAGRNVKNSRAVIDQVAAQMILQNYLDAEQLRAGMLMPQEEEYDEDGYAEDDDR
jgi:putative Holliday junction resolvase